MHIGVNMTDNSKRASLPFAGKVALVTGGSRGIGAAIVKRFARDGAKVAFTYHQSAKQADELVASLRALGVGVSAIRADSADAAAVVAAVEKTATEFGGLDILVNNAGILHWYAFDDFRLEDFDQTFAINVRSVFVASQAAARRMKEGGRIINISSCNARRVSDAGGGIYAMSKSALSGLVHGLSRDLGPRGITVNNVLPGPTDTDMNPAHGDHAAGMHARMAVARHGHADEVAGMVAYVASAEAGMITGADLLIDGGFAA
jgi:3-oxoacyl-[acyl-carrier protein] reductase